MSGWHLIGLAAYIAMFFLCVALVFAGDRKDRSFMLAMAVLNACLAVVTALDA